jgi:hypothetical protein
MNTVAQVASRPLFTRFLWKEYRMLRGFWLAAFVIAWGVQWTVRSVFHEGAAELALVAWSAAALYAVGAAITLFAAETEEHTRDYLRLLPGDWKPMFAAKVVTAVASIVLLGIALSLTGAGLRGFPDHHAIREILRLAGVAAIEGLCWGLLFSLWWRQPLLAAVAAMACGSLGAQLAISFGTNSQNSWTAQAYADAAPARLLICLGVFAGAVLLGRRWFYPQATDSNATAEREETIFQALPLSAKKNLPRTKMFSRLLWQTWRESWKSMLVGILLGLVMFILLMIPEDFVPGFRGYWMLLMSLVPVAILGALVFRPDQQREHRLFAATHAIPPRRMWLSRQAIWLTLIVVLGTALNAYFSWYVANFTDETIMSYFRGDWNYTQLMGREYSNQESPWTQAWRLERSRELYQQGVLTAWCAIFAAYGAGQFCSMLLRQSLLAGFLAILFSIAIAGWSLLMFLWQMPPLVYILPIGVAALIATWLRTPSWVIGRNSLKHWLLPALVLILPLSYFVHAIPEERNDQIHQTAPEFPFLKEPFAQMVGNYNAQYSSRKKLADEVTLLVANIQWPHVLEITVGGKSLDEFGISEHKFDGYRDDAGVAVSDEDRKIIDRFQAELRHLRAERNQETIKRIVALTERPSFSQIIDTQHMSTLAGLLRDDAARLTSEDDLAGAWQRLTALIRFDEWFKYQQLPTLDAILAWANQFDQTSDQLKAAISELHDAFQELPLPSERILARYPRSRSMILEKESPYESTPPSLILSNRLPGEQERGLVALDYLTAQKINYANAVVHLSRGGTARMGMFNADYDMVDNPRELVRRAPWFGMYAINQIAFNGNWRDFVLANQMTDAAASSFFAARIVEQSGHLKAQLQNWVDAETRRRAILIQLALLAYRIDHDEYPETLEALQEYWPAGWSWNIRDPYSNKPFEYRQQGLEHDIADHSEKTLVSAGTPLLWSVGSGDSYLRESFEYDSNQNAIANDKQPDVGKTVYHFISTERGGSSENLVFPLP